MAESVFVPEVQAQARALAALLLPKVREYFKDEENRKAFEVWYEKKYGKKYKWEPIERRNENGK